MKKEGIILARVSSFEQMDQGVSIEAQIDRLKKYAESKEVKIIETVSFAESSYRKKRKKFMKLVDQLRKRKFTILIADAVDRVSRDFKSTVALSELVDEGKLELHFHRENLVINKESTAMDKLKWDMSVLFAKNYVVSLSENVKRSFELKRQRGEFTNLAPMGYLNIRDKYDVADIIVDSKKAPFIKKIFELAENGESVRSITKIMEQEGLRSRNNKAVSRSQIHSMLQNSFYCGFIRRTSGEKIPHKYEIIISVERFIAVQRSLSKKYNLRDFKDTTPQGRKSKKSFVLKNIFICGHCGCTITPERKIKKNGKEYNLYSCTNSKGICKREYVNEEKLVEQVIGAFGQFEIRESSITQLSEEMNNEISAENGYIAKKITSFKKRRTEIGDLLDGLVDKYALDKISEDIYTKRKERLETEKKELDLDIRESKKNNGILHVDKGIITHLANSVEKIFRSVAVTEQNELVKCMVKSAKMYGKEKVEIEFHHSFSFLGRERVTV